MVTYVDDSENVLECHICEKYKQGSLKVGEVFDGVFLALENGCDQTGDELTKQEENKYNVRIYHKNTFCLLTIVWKTLIRKTFGSLMMEIHDRHKRPGIVKTTMLCKAIELLISVLKICLCPWMLDFLVQKVKLFSQVQMIQTRRKSV